MTKLIVDVGSNWKKFDGEAKNYEIAVRQIEAAAEGGADYVKFQMYTDKELYGKAVLGINEFALPRKWIPKLKKVADKTGIGFMCTGFSVEGYKYLNDYVDVHKVASAEATSAELMDTVTRLGKTVLVSNGANSTLTAKYPGCIVMHCVSDYPARVENYVFELKAAGYSLIDGRRTGLSDHTAPHKTDLATMAHLFGYGWVEIHFDYNKEVGDIITPDFPVSRNLDQLKEYASILKVAIRPDKKSFSDKYARRDGNVLFTGCFRPQA